MSEIALLSKYVDIPVKLQDPANLSQIKAYQNKLETCRIEQFESLIKSVSAVRGSLENLKTEVTNNFVREQRDNLKMRMLNMGSGISDLKDLIREELCFLIKEENSLTKELELLEKRIEDWDKPVSTQSFKVIKMKGAQVESSNNNPTVEFQKFLSTTGGHCGGWIEQDHLLFLRERNKCKGKTKFISIVHQLLPDLTYDEILHHEEWYLKYESLKNSQKEAIQKWKASKVTRQEQVMKSSNVKKEINPRSKELYQKNIAERINEWKKQQLLKKLEEEERQKEEQKRLKEERERNKEIQKLKKKAINQYRAEKLCKIQDELSFQKENKLEMMNTKEKKNILMKAFRLQDIKYIERKKIIRLRLESKTTERVERLKLVKPALDIIARRDPQRVLQPTLIWDKHCQQDDRKEKMNPICDLNAIPHLWSKQSQQYKKQKNEPGDGAIPEWRKDLK